MGMEIKIKMYTIIFYIGRDTVFCVFIFKTYLKNVCAYASFTHHYYIYIYIYIYIYTSYMICVCGVFIFFFQQNGIISH